MTYRVRLFFADFMGWGCLEEKVPVSQKANNTVGPLSLPHIGPNFYLGGSENALKIEVTAKLL